jgi:hypothetical protein
LSEEERIALHNVTSALCNRKQVKDIIEEAIMGVCIALRVSMPEKKGKGKGKKNEREEQEQQADDIEAKPEKAASKRVTTKKLGESLSGEESSAESWGGLSAVGDPDDSEAEQKAFSRFEGLLGGSSDEDEADDGVSDEEDLQNSRARSIRGPSDHFSGSSADEDEDSSEEEEEEDNDEDEDSDDEALAPPPKKSRAKATKAASAAADGNSTFLPSLMGGYISGSESDASDLEEFAPKKNRRGQRARQAIWEKKFKEQARHIQLQKQKDSRDDGWDLKRGAVGAEDAGPWKKGVRNPFEKPQPAPEGVHPQRHGNFAREARESREVGEIREVREPREPRHNVPEERPKPAGPKRDDIGALHPSWEAARKAKETSQKIAFEGRKIVFSD